MLEREDAVLVVIDYQDSLLTKIPVAEPLLAQAVKLIRVARELDVPIVWTEQYPKGLGKTAEKIATELKGRELRTLVAAPGRGRPQEHNSRARLGAYSARSSDKN